jgi:hypothetical protein
MQGDQMQGVCAGVAVLAAGLYSGAAWYVSFVEGPALAAAPDADARSQWQRHLTLTPRYAAFALLSTVCALIAGKASPACPWTWGALVIFAVLPVTTVLILPVQRRLQVVTSVEDWRPLHLRWARLHAVRTGLGLTATILFLWAALRQVG